MDTHAWTSRLDEMVNLETGDLDRRIFSDQEIFDREMDTIFTRAWLFLCHETQIPKRGDFFEAPMGRDNVLVVRQRDGGLKAFLNTCSHRGNAVCRAEEGNVKNFMCTYHGWTYDLGGELIGVPGQGALYSNDLDKSKYPLRKVAQLESYKGFVFATFDETAPPLHEYLGATGRLGLDLLAERGELEAVPGIQKFIINANWKLAVDNNVDWYHPQITHMSAQAVGLIPTPVSFSALGNDGATTSEGDDLSVQWQQADLDHLVLVAEYGHAISGPKTASMAAVSEAHPWINGWRTRPEAIDAIGPVGIESMGHPQIFPTAWVTQTAQVSLRIPRGPNLTEVWWYSFRVKGAPEEDQKQMLFMQNHAFGPAGLLEQEDGENWAQASLNTHGTMAKTVPHLLKMGLGRGKIIKEHGLSRIDAPTNEYGQLWLYASWKAWLGNPSWDELRQRTTPGDVL